MLDGQRELLGHYLAGGLDAVHARQVQLVRANRHGKRIPDAASPAVAPHGATVGAITIEDVALDGTFPADGYEQRMHAWVRSIAGEPPGVERG